MDILGLIGYGIAAFAAAVVLTLVYSLFRPIKKHDEILSWRVLGALYVLALAAPYGYVEFMTRRHAAPMAAAVAETADEATTDGTLLFFKVFKCSENRARVIAVSRERSSWGGDERSVMAINMEKVGGKWESVEFNWVTSDQRNADSVSLPPYL